MVQLLVSEIQDWGSPTWTELSNFCLGRGSPLPRYPLTSQAGDAIAASAGSTSYGLPLIEPTLCCFVPFLANHSMSSQTASVYFSACMFFHIFSTHSYMISSTANVHLEEYVTFCFMWQESETASNAGNFEGHTHKIIGQAGIIQ